MLQQVKQDRKGRKTRSTRAEVRAGPSDWALSWIEGQDKREELKVKEREEEVKGEEEAKEETKAEEKFVSFENSIC